MEKETSFNLWTFIIELLTPILELVGLDGWVDFIALIVLLLLFLYLLFTILAILLWPMKKIWYGIMGNKQEEEKGGCCFFISFIIFLTPIPFVAIFMSLSSS